MTEEEIVLETRLLELLAALEKAVELVDENIEDVDVDVVLFTGMDEDEASDEVDDADDVDVETEELVVFSTEEVILEERVDEEVVKEEELVE